MRESGDDGDTLREVGINLALVAVGAAAYYASKGNGGSSQPVAVTDYDWDSDQFFHQCPLVWACRGVQTGQFAEQSYCACKTQTDFHWPAK